MMKRLSCAGLALSLLILSGGCSRDPLREAKKMERLGRYKSALDFYEAYAAKNPKSESAPEALQKSAEIYRNVIKDYAAARERYRRISRGGFGKEWQAKAEAAEMNCPDYFPLNPDYVRRSGDSQSGGDFMKTEETVEALAAPAGRFKLKRRVFAGDALVSTFEKIYEKKNGELLEHPLGAGQPAVVLKLPPVVNQQWKTLRDGKTAEFTVESEKAEVEIRAGKFSNCLKLRVRNPEIPGGWKVEYYAPDLGLVLAAAATENGETPISELTSYIPKKSKLNPPPAETKPEAPSTAPIDMETQAVAEEKSAIEKTSFWDKAKSLLKKKHKKEKKNGH